MKGNDEIPENTFRLFRTIILLFCFLMLAIVLSVPDIAQGQKDENEDDGDDHDDDKGDGSPFFVCCLASVCCAGITLLLILQIVIGIWVYKDAESRGDSGVMWLIVVLVGGIVGLIIYLIVRKDIKPGGTFGSSSHFYKPQYPPQQQATKQPLQEDEQETLK